MKNHPRTKFIHRHVGDQKAIHQSWNPNTANTLLAHKSTLILVNAYVFISRLDQNRDRPLKF